MSFEVLEQLESKIQQAVDTITLLQMEVDELKEKNDNLTQQIEAEASQKQQLIDENRSLKGEQGAWQERLRTMLNKMENVK